MDTELPPQESEGKEEELLSFLDILMMYVRITVFLSAGRDALQVHSDAMRMRIRKPKMSLYGDEWLFSAVH